MADLAQRAKDLHDNLGMPWAQADELALREAGITDADIDEMIGEHAGTVLIGFLPRDDLRQFVRGILVHESETSATASVAGMTAKFTARRLTDDEIQSTRYVHGKHEYDFDPWLEKFCEVNGIQLSSNSTAPTVGHAVGSEGERWLPTSENINALPEPVRQYIMQLETQCDPAGMVRENAQLKDTNEGLQRMYRSLADAVGSEGDGVAPAAPTLTKAQQQHIHDAIGTLMVCASGLPLSPDGLKAAARHVGNLQALLRDAAGVEGSKPP